jgi:hypothetical protein
MRSGGRLLMGAAVAVLGAAFVVLATQPTDADANAKARERVLAALPAVSPAPDTQRTISRALLGPSVLAQRAPRPAPPALLTLPGDVATPLPVDSPEAKREIQLSPSEISRPTVYRLPDGRLFVLQQTPADRGRPALVNWFEETSVRGQVARSYSAPTGPFRALVWWTEGPVSYYLYSATVTTRELVRLTDELR